ncbi:hypothetical protein CRM22_006505, partial [Opisthorchis felineus]
RFLKNIIGARTLPNRIPENEPNFTSVYRGNPEYTLVSWISVEYPKASTPSCQANASRLRDTIKNHWYSLINVQIFRISMQLAP